MWRLYAMLHMKQRHLVTAFDGGTCICILIVLYRFTRLVDYL
jgi:hypothetical protein